MQALGMIETKGLLAAIEAADTMLKAADVTFLEKQKVGGGRVTVLVTGDVAAVKAAVDAGVMAVKQIQAECFLSCHVIPRPHDETMELLAKYPEPAEIPVELEEPLKPEKPAKPEELKSDAPAKNSEEQEKAETKSNKKNKKK